MRGHGHGAMHGSHGVAAVPQVVQGARVAVQPGAVPVQAIQVAGQPPAMLVHPAPGHGGARTGSAVPVYGHFYHASSGMSSTR